MSAHGAPAETSHGLWTRLGDVIGVACVLYYAYVAVVGIFNPELDRSLFVFVGVALSLIYHPLRWGPAGRAIDMALVAVAAWATLHFIAESEDFALNVGLPLAPIDVWLGWAMMLISLEAGRRALGASIPLLALAALFYLYRGDLIPAPFSHSGFDTATIASHMYAGTEGMYGGITYILASQMLLFLVFGAFITRSGAADFYSDICMAMVGRRHGGTAKTAVSMSLIVGSVTGSAAANVAITGTVTIPMMMRSGVQPPVAAAIEAAASTGGTVMPPVMGVAAFVMVAITGISYGTIALVSAVPALLYFLSVYSQVHFYAQRRGLGGVTDEKLPGLRPTLRRGWWFFLPIVVVTWLIYADYSLARIGLLATITTIAASWLSGRGRTAMNLSGLWTATVESARGSLSILAVAAPVSIISEAILLPGTGLRLTGAIIDLGGGNLALTLAIVFVIAYVLGMGLSVVPAYLVLATLAAPALVQLGVPLLAAHLLVVWWSNASNITPPVALATYVAASIARTSLWKAGNAAIVKAAALLYLPVLFVYQPPLILNGGWLDCIVAGASATIGVLALSVAIEGYWRGPANLIERLGFGVAGVVLMVAGVDLWLLVGSGLLALLAMPRLLRKSESRVAG
ncbi:MAG: TRAP transporter fused permease subunit [Alphaproteobacteria bacterium]|nr:TRAP transporter fused permease subunit [Alphaproteobacteria bacterium]